MRKHLRRTALGALAIGAISGVAAIALPATTTAATEWQPSTYNLSEPAAQLLPATVSAAKPVRVVSTSVDASGKPVIKVTTATSKSAAASAVKSGQDAQGAVGVELDAVVTASDAPTGTDTYRSQQWDFNKISVASAWTKSTGSGVTVAVLDTGVDAKHPDLAADLVGGYDAIANTAGVTTDPNGHGTHVAGTIAAVTGNGIGISGIAPGAKIMPIRVLNDKGSGYMSDTAEGIIWATDHGAGVINMSLGATSQVTAVTNAISYARSKGVVVVAAAGNERQDGSPTSYPAADAGVIGVAATDSSDKVGSYSNAGSYVDVAAPGSSILSTYPTALGGKTGYATMSGTSMASPHVAAVAALLKAYDKSLTPDQVESALETSAVDLGTKGRDNDYGYGRIDAVAALAAVTKATTAPTTAPATTAPATTAPTTTAPTTAPATTAPTTAPTTAAPTTSPTKPAVKVTPSIRVTTSTTSSVYGATVTVTYALTANNAPFASQPVKIVMTPAGGKATTIAATTDAYGKVVFSRSATAPFQVRLDVPASDSANPVSSPTVTFSVRSTASVTSPAARQLELKLAGPSGQTIEVQRLEKSKWVKYGTFTAGTGTTLVKPLPSGATVRLVVPTKAGVTGVTTGSVKIA
ncbi:S8 family peptidase [Actinoplanes bogorensis]|uniref:S8 family peptidase n=1 Tax=Paractinoplanes bogorensis TaxID=1610840 RepID=A0ABS5YSK6_9ACTN|nr:S8 family peptidase [Actinoplanes bogorensis]MBU2666442.1 S8 family peptidase [Actinoplanes bogorensis]